MIKYSDGWHIGTGIMPDNGVAFLVNDGYVVQCVKPAVTYDRSEVHMVSCDPINKDGSSLIGRDVDTVCMDAVFYL